MVLAIVITSSIGLALYFVKDLFFVSPFNRMLRILSFIASLIPFGVGIIYMIILICAFAVMCNLDMNRLRYVDGNIVCDVTNDMNDAYIRDSAITRYLFNNINWQEVDKNKAYSMKSGNDKHIS